MTRVLVATGDDMSDRLRRCGVDVVGACDAADLAASDSDGLSRLLTSCDAVLVPGDHGVLDAAFIARCDRGGVRIVALAEESRRSRAHAFGLACVASADVWDVVDALAGGLSAMESAAEPADAPWTVGASGAESAADAGIPRRGQVIAVWGPAGAPGRSTVATLLAAELARGGRRVALVDADVHAPSLALTLGLSDEGPGLAAACRSAAQGALDPQELSRVAQIVRAGDEVMHVLAGINRPSRWPELAADRVAAALAVCRDWVEYTVVDVGASLERDEELVSDLDGPRRNAATHAVLEAADLVVAVGAADPLGASRLLRGLAELQAHAGVTPVRVLVNRLRAGALGLDARGQLRRAFERFADVDEVWFLPVDQRAADAALRDARVVSDAVPRSPLVAAARRFVGEAVVPALNGRPHGLNGTLRGVRGTPTARTVTAPEWELEPEGDATHVVLPTVLRPRPRTPSGTQTDRVARPQRRGRRSA